MADGGRDLFLASNIEEPEPVHSPPSGHLRYARGRAASGSTVTCASCGLTAQTSRGRCFSARAIHFVQEQSLCGQETRAPRRTRPEQHSQSGCRRPCECGGSHRSRWRQALAQSKLPPRSARHDMSSAFRGNKCDRVDTVVRLASGVSPIGDRRGNRRFCAIYNMLYSCLAVPRSAGAASADPTWSCGLARAKITPDKLFWMGGLPPAPPAEGIAG